MPNPLSKGDLKNALEEALEPFAKGVQTDFRKINERFDKVDSRLDSVELELHEVRNDVREMKENSSELFTKLDKFISLYEKQGQELLILNA